jgi:hypothetical protein
MADTTNSYKVLERNSDRKRPFGRARYRINARQ